MASLYDKNYYNNPYVHGKTKNKNPPVDEPDGMYRPPRPKTLDISKTPVGVIPTDEEIDAAFQKILGTRPKHQPKPTDRDMYIGLDLVNRHRYGDRDDILAGRGNARFVKTRRELEAEEDALVLACRELTNTVYNSCLTAPKQEKYVLCVTMRTCALEGLCTAISIKKKYYRKNLLQDLDIQMEELRELYRIASMQYTDWITTSIFEYVLGRINNVGKIIGWLLKATVV